MGRPGIALYAATDLRVFGAQRALVEQIRAAGPTAVVAALAALVAAASEEAEGSPDDDPIWLQFGVLLKVAQLARALEPTLGGPDD